MRRTIVPTILAAAICLALAGREATATTYAIDPTQSQLTFTMYASGIPISEAQFPGSDTASLSGTLDAAVVGSTISFTDTNNIVFGDQPSPVLPGPNPSPSNGTIGVLPDNPGTGDIGNYGLIIIVPGGPDLLDLSTAALAGYGDVRNEIATLNGSSTITGGLFSAAPLSLGLVSSYLDWNLNTGNGDGPPQTGSSFLTNSEPLGGYAGVNSSAGAGSLLGSVLTVPINEDVLTNLGGVYVDVVFTGQIVASTVPEPGTFVLAAIGLAALFAGCKRDWAARTAKRLA